MGRRCRLTRTPTLATGAHARSQQLAASKPQCADATASMARHPGTSLFTMHSTQGPPSSPCIGLTAWSSPPEATPAGQDLSR